VERTDLEAQHKTSAMHGLLKSYLQQQHDLERASQVERHEIECKHLIDSHEQVWGVVAPLARRLLTPRVILCLQARMAMTKRQANQTIANKKK